MLKKTGLALLVILIVIQFIRPAKNDSNDETNAVGKKYPIPADVQKTLAAACYDCHSNNTKYPWYFNIQPVAWYLNSHINDGKRHLNFSDFTSRRLAIQNHRFEEIMDMVDKGEMPLKSYTLLHQEAVLTDDQRQGIIQWAQTQMDTLKARYPADSLVMPKRPGSPGGPPPSSN